ncbi:helix-turn-helix domain-containing protein [Dactylosporangium sp. CS-033363]|uniref:helix-turn-helix domain-containing protein n=1 Tax=Dactylosporangium sp. CS-033363 TaxID=3239935 RepID=UPI003D8FDDF8
MPDEPELTFGRRVRILRERSGKTRAVLGGLVGRSEEWVKAIETGKLLTPRLPLLLSLADVLGVDDLAELTGDQSIPVASVTKATHPATAAIAEAMNRPVVARDVDPDSADVHSRVGHAWQLWHGSTTERTAVAAVLPDLLRDARAVVRLVDGADRRRAYADLAQVYHLCQLFLAHQPAAELVWLAADRGMQAAQDADDPLAIATAAWYYAYVYRGAGQFAAAEEVVGDVIPLLDPEASTDHLARWGQLQLGVALASAKAGRGGVAWKYWDRSSGAADALGRGYLHPRTMFGRFTVDAFAVTIDVELFRAGEAVVRAERLDLGDMPSHTRRAAFLMDSARAHHQRREHVAVVHLLGRALRESVETTRHQPFARQAILELMGRRGTVRDDARELALSVGLLG